MPPRPSLPEIFFVALRLGCTSFGGPVAHLAFFRREYVEKRRWLDEAHYADLVALCQFLPGPASSQTGFGVGYLQRGLAGGLAAWLGFTLPSALLMIGLACGIGGLGNLEGAGWLKGLKAAAVAVVAQAVWAMWRSLCPDLPRSVLAGASAGLLLVLTPAWSQVAVIGAGAVVGWMFFQAPDTAPQVATAGLSRRTGAAWLAVFFILLGLLPVLAHLTGNPALDIFARFYRTGSLVFGGGHVVLPLLEREVVAPGWVTHDQFLAGYGAAQAVPGPLFTFAAYLGTVMNHGQAHSTGSGQGGILGGVWALLAIFLPALLLVAGALPFWQVLRHRPAAQAALRGANAAVVGVLLAALWHPVGTAGITNGRSLGLAVAAFLALQMLRAPAWSVVGAAAALGAVLL